MFLQGVLRQSANYRRQEPEDMQLLKFSNAGDYPGHQVVLGPSRPTSNSAGETLQRRSFRVMPVDAQGTGILWCQGSNWGRLHVRHISIL